MACRHCGLVPLPPSRPPVSWLTRTQGAAACETSLFANVLFPEPCSPHSTSTTGWRGGSCGVLAAPPSAAGPVPEGSEGLKPLDGRMPASGTASCLRFTPTGGCCGSCGGSCGAEPGKRVNTVSGGADASSANESPGCSSVCPSRSSSSGGLSAPWRSTAVGLFPVEHSVAAPLTSSNTAHCWRLMCAFGEYE